MMTNGSFGISAKPTRSTGNTVLIADDDASIRTVLSQALARAGFQVRSTSNASTLWKWVKENEGDLVLTDVMMPDGSVFDFLPRIRMERPKLPIIVMSAQNTLLTAMSAAEQGAYEYLPKPFDLERMIDLIKKALEPVPEHKAVVQKRRALNDENLPLIGRSQLMQDVYRTLSRIAPSDLPVLIEGEVGTGKSLIARTIVEFSPRKNGVTKSVNLSHFENSSDFDKLFFGQNFDGAGLLEELSGGTLIIENFADAPLATQARLSALLTNITNNSVRIIATSSASARDKVASGVLLPELYYQLNVVSIRVPPLRERTDDIGDLARLFLSRASKEGTNEKILEKGAIEELETWPWHGNVRELENLMRRISVLNSESTVTKSIISSLFTDNGVANIQETSVQEGDLSSVTRAALLNLFATAKNDGAPLNDLYSTVIRMVEKPLFELTLRETRGNQIRAAELLGLNRNTLRKRLTELNIQ